MALNDRDPTLAGSKGTDVYPGVANPTVTGTAADPNESNFVNDPTTEARGAGAGPNFTGDVDAARNFKQTAGVIEGRPGVIESTHIDPLAEDSNKDDGWAKVNSGGTKATMSGLEKLADESISGAKSGKPDKTSTIGSIASQAANTATGAAKLAYGHATGNEDLKKEGSEAVYGESK